MAMTPDLILQVVDESVIVRKRSHAHFRKIFPLAWKPMIEAYQKGLTPSQAAQEAFAKGNPMRLSDWTEFVREVEGSATLQDQHRRQMKELDLGPGWFEYSVFSFKLFGERNLGSTFYTGFYFLCLMMWSWIAFQFFAGVRLAGFLSLEGSYVQSFLGLVLGLSLLGLTKGLILILLHVLATGSLPETKIAWRGLMIDISVDTSPIEAHRIAQLKIFFFVSSAVAYMAAALLWKSVQIPGLSYESLSVLAVLLTFVSLNPKRRGETSKIFGILYPQWKARRFLSYLENRSLFAIFRKGHWIEDESKLLQFAVLCVGWSLGFLVFLSFLFVSNIRPLMQAWSQTTGLEWFSVFAISGVLAGVMGLVIFELWRVLIRNFLFLFQRQIQNFFRNRSIRTEKKFETGKIRQFMAQSPLFQGFPESVIDGFLSLGFIQVVREGQPLIIQGNVGTELYMILEGEAVVRRQEATGDVHDLAVLSKGAIFGEMSLLRNVVRSAHVISLSPLRVFVLPKANFESLFRGLTNVRTLEQRIALSGVLGDSSIFKGLPKETLQIILGYGEFVEFKAGQTVIEQGDRDKDFYIVLRGRVEVVRAGDIRLSELGPATFFGEVALFENRPRSATIRVIEDAVLLKVSQEGFWRMVDQNPSLAANIQELSWLRRQAPESLGADAL